MVIQSKKGIKTDQLGKGDKPRSVIVIEVVMKISTYSILIFQVFNIILGISMLHISIRIIGFILSLLGVAIFAISVCTMHDNWRAGISDNEKTEMVTSGIYSVSRNPAFVGFDLMYIGILIMFFSIILSLITVFVILIFHLQILQEEKFLLRLFGEQYTNYKKAVKRYFGRKK